MKKGSSNCRIHGYTEDVVINRDEYFSCKICKYRLNKEWRDKEENKKKLQEYLRRYKLSNPEKIQILDFKYKIERLKARKINMEKKILDPTVKCLKHGLTRDVLKFRSKAKSGIPAYRCRLCHNERGRRYAKRRREKSYGSRP